MEPVAGKYRIAMVSDFFDPRIGGVENHIHQLSAALVAQGHKVVVVTNSFQQQGSDPTKRVRAGVVWMRGGLKVYRCPLPELTHGVTLPAIALGSVAALRCIFIRERIDVVHAHQNTSTLMHEVLLIARMMGLPTVFTDHSLVGFVDLGCITLNGALAYSLSHTCHTICVSHTCKENLVLRAEISPDVVSVIPNAFNPSQFLPRPHSDDDDDDDDDDDGHNEGELESSMVTIVLMSRLVYRKGLDLVVPVIPEICTRFPNVRFVIGGDGPKRLALEEMREQWQLQERVELLGEVEHENVCGVLQRGDIFLNCSLTEGFCIAIVEAASCGLRVVTTQVGGIPEVLPPHMVTYARPSVNGVVDALSSVITIVQQQRRSSVFEIRQRQHNEVAVLYNWGNIAQRTTRVYDRVVAMPQQPILLHFAKNYSVGWIVGKLWCVVSAICWIAIALLDWFIAPRASIDIAPELPRSIATFHALEIGDGEEEEDDVGK